jgi:predicted outer membrane repeat protein
MILSGATDSSIRVEKEGSLTLINSILKDNDNTADALGGGAGGALHCESESTIDIDYCQFFRNRALYGGAVYGAKESKIFTVESLFKDNEAIIGGGAVANGAESESRFENAKFRNNKASSGGAFLTSQYSTTLILGSEFDQNLGINGGAIFSGGDSVVMDTTFHQNFAEDSGGAMYIDAGSAPDLRRNEFRNNNAGEWGPAVNDRFQTLVEMEENIACGNMVQSKNSGCDGVFVFIGRRRFRCEPFVNECELASSQPSVPPSAAPTSSPNLPSAAPTHRFSNIPSEMPTLAPTHYSSSLPSDMPSLIPSNF